MNHASEINDQSDFSLLQRYATTREPELFSELANRYAGSVYWTCFRITGNSHDAEEMTQECFFELVRQANAVTSSVSGWLHRLATNRSLNTVRARKRRIARESATSLNSVSSDLDITWKEISPVLDAAIEELPDDLRVPIIQHFLEGKSQAKIAAALSLNQSTISRRIRDAIEELRSNLRKNGVYLGSAATLTTFLTDNSSESASTQLIGEIGKIGLAGMGPMVASTTLTVGAWLNAVACFIGPILVQVVFGAWFGFFYSAAFVGYAMFFKPKWLTEWAVAVSGDRQAVEDFSPYAAWGWNTPPPNARNTMRSALITGLFLVALAVGSLMSNWFDRHGLAAMFLVYAIIPLTTACRIYTRTRNQSKVASSNELEEPPIQLVDVFQTAVFGIVGIQFLVLALDMSFRIEDMRKFWVVLAILAGVLTMGAGWNFRRKFRTYRLQTPLKLLPVKTTATTDVENNTSVIKFLVVVSTLCSFSALMGFMNARRFSEQSTMHLVGIMSSVAIFHLGLCVRPIAAVKQQWSPARWRRWVMATTSGGVLGLSLFAVWAVSAASSHTHFLRPRKTPSEIELDLHAKQPNYVEESSAVILPARLLPDGIAYSENEIFPVMGDMEGRTVGAEFDLPNVSVESDFYFECAYEFESEKDAITARAYGFGSSVDAERVSEAWDLAAIRARQSVVIFYDRKGKLVSAKIDHPLIVAFRIHLAEKKID